jgi:predicted ATPase with chaperone activity
MLIDVKKENLTTILEEKSSEDSKSIKEKVLNARKIQQKRFE